MKERNEKQQAPRRTPSESEIDERSVSPGHTPGKAEGDPETIREALKNQEKKPSNRS